MTVVICCDDVGTVCMETKVVGMDKNINSRDLKMNADFVTDKGTRRLKIS